MINLPDIFCNEVYSVVEILQCERKTILIGCLKTAHFSFYNLQIKKKKKNQNNLAEVNLIDRIHFVAITK